MPSAVLRTGVPVPALMSTELPEPDGPPMRVRLLGENLIAFRDSRGRVGLLANHCPHRSTGPIQGFLSDASRRGPQALLELTTWAERGYDLAITPDGPRGPRYEVQAGAIALAQLTGQPLVPCCYSLAWKITLKSWDRFQIPLPFGRAVMRFGEPLRVPREASDEQRELLRLQLQERLRELTVDY